MKEFFDIVSGVGFPIAVAGFLLFRVEKKIDEMRKSSDALTAAIESYKQQVGSKLDEIITVLTIKRK